MPNSLSGSPSEREVALLFEQLAALTASGLPLPSGLRAASEELASSRMRSIFRKLADQLEEGVNLHSALASRDHGLPEPIRGLVLAGAQSGRLAEVLGEFVRRSNTAHELRVKFWTMLAYPILALVLIVALVGFICTLSVRTFDTLSSGFGGLVQPPKRTQSEVLLIMARFINEHGLEILITAMTTVVLLILTVRWGLAPAKRRRLICHLPVLGPQLRFTAVTEFCHLLAMLLDSRMPLPMALDLAGKSVRDADLAESCTRMSQAVSRGQPLSIAIILWKGIPAGLGQLFRGAEGHQNLPDLLRVAGDIFEARSRSQGDFAIGIISAFLMLMILWWVGFAVAALYLPMITIIQVLSSLAGII